MNDNARELGERVAAERARQRYTVKSASEAAGIARDTWKRIEAGLGVHDTSRAAALELLGLGPDGRKPEKPTLRQVVSGDAEGAVVLPREVWAEMVASIQRLELKVSELTQATVTELAARDRGKPSRGSRLRDEESDPA